MGAAAACEAARPILVRLRLLQRERADRQTRLKNNIGASAASLVLAALVPLIVYLRPEKCSSSPAKGLFASRDPQVLASRAPRQEEQAKVPSATTTIRRRADACDIKAGHGLDAPAARLVAETTLDTCTRPARGFARPPVQVDWRRRWVTGARRRPAAEASDHLAYLNSRAPPLGGPYLRPHQLRPNLTSHTAGRETSAAAPAASERRVERRDRGPPS